MFYNRVLGILILSILGFAFSCSTKYEEAESLKKQLNHDLKNNSWKITHYTRHAHDLTSNWDSLFFVFKSGDDLVVNTDSADFHGWWKLIILDEQFNNMAHDYINFNIGFNTHSRLDSLNDDWCIVSYSNYKLELMELVADTNLVDFLTFEKK